MLCNLLKLNKQGKNNTEKTHKRKWNTTLTV